MADTFQPAKKRNSTLDALRGFALLGILVPNAISFAWPMEAIGDSGIIGMTSWNQLGIDLTSTAFLGKFMFLFALLFGAGVVLFDRKTEPRPQICFCGRDMRGLASDEPCPDCGMTVRVAEPAKLTDGAALWYRRCLVLLGMGLIHGYFFWYGDILTYYAIAGLTLLWWVRKLPAKTQLWGGLGLFTLGSLILLGLTALGLWAFSEGKIPLEDLVGANADDEIAGYLGSWVDALRTRAPATFMAQVSGAFFMPTLWGIMVTGMGLTKLGILTGERSTRYHATLGLALVIIGAPITYFLYQWVQTTTDMPGLVWQSIAQFVGLPLALGYSQLVVAMTRVRWFSLVTKGLANVGRMALTNYLLHTLIMTTLMYGYGFGLFASIEYPELFSLIGAVWIFNFLFSAVWLRYFAQGPMEWLWRRMTYGRSTVPGGAS